ncbi:hypothetical protein Lser_V15G24467 [Lactuca serriola]
MNDVCVRSLVMATSSSSSHLLLSNSRSTKKIFDYANSCGCGRHSRIWTSRTKDRLEKKFRICLSRWEPNK